MRYFEERSWCFLFVSYIFFHFFYKFYEKDYISQRRLFCFLTANFSKTLLIYFRSYISEMTHLPYVIQPRAQNYESMGRKMIAGNFYLQLTRGCPLYMLLTQWCVFLRYWLTDMRQVSFQNRGKVSLINTADIMSYLAPADPWDGDEGFYTHM